MREQTNWKFKDSFVYINQSLAVLSSQVFYAGRYKVLKGGSYFQILKSWLIKNAKGCTTEEHKKSEHRVQSIKGVFYIYFPGCLSVCLYFQPQIWCLPPYNHRATKMGGAGQAPSHTQCFGKLHLGALDSLLRPSAT